MSSGKVFLIGAGPGDPELLTLKAVRCLAQADVILLDDLVDRGVLRFAGAAARVISVGKRGGCKSTPQAFIERLMVRLARRGKIVARVKGGDPLVFGRGGEEMEALVVAGIEVEVVPGITAGIGVPAALGIPVTHRDIARGVTFVTGHTHDGAEVDWGALARTGTTLVIYMGMSRLPRLVAEMLEKGFPSHMPACAIQNGTLATQREVVTTLGELAVDVAGAGLGSPAILIVGDVVRYARVAAALPALRATEGRR